MFIQCSKVKRKGKISRNRKLSESYRDKKTKQPRVRTVQKIEMLPIAERAKVIYENGGQKHLTTEEWKILDQEGLLSFKKQEYEVGDVYRGAGTAVALRHLKQSGLFAVLDQQLDRRTSMILQELIIHQLIYPKSKLKFSKQRQSSLLYALGGKRSYKEDSVYLAMDELDSKIEGIKSELNKLAQTQSKTLLLYDLSNSYFTGTKAELGGRGQSKEKRHDRYIVTYGLVMNGNNMPLDLKIWKGGTADSKTVLETFSQWKQTYKAERAVWIADRSMSGEPTLEEVSQLELNHITGLPGNAQHAALLIQHEQQPELFDQRDLSAIEHNGKRYVLCRHQSKGYRKEKQAMHKRRKVYQQLKKIQRSPQNKDEKKLYHRAMKVLEQNEQTDLWGISTKAFSDEKQRQRYRLNFWLDRKTAVTNDRVGHYYLLQTDLGEDEMNDQQIVDNYQSLMKVEKSFRDVKSQIEIRPVRHWKKRRIKGHIYLCYLSLWLSKYIENNWKEKEIPVEVGSQLLDWDRDLLLCEKVDQQGNITETKWNRGKRASQAKLELEEFGESDVLKQFW